VEKINNRINEAKNTVKVLKQKAEELEQEAKEKSQEAERLRQKTEEQIRQTEKLEKEIYTDKLTGCLNFAYYEKLIAYWDQQIDNDNKFALVFIDINNLKSINDNIGHDAGDELIKKTADYLKEIFRKKDDVIRIGGDEFIIFCINDNNISGFAEILEEKLAGACQQAPSIQFNRKPPFEKITDEIEMSFAYGVTVSRTTDCGVDATKQRADKKMYTKKAEMKAKKETEQISTNQTAINPTIVKEEIHNSI
jgi:diguanylate cyclase (GGDEF)-like protein